MTQSTKQAKQHVRSTTAKQYRAHTSDARLIAHLRLLHLPALQMKGDACICLRKHLLTEFGAEVPSAADEKLQWKEKLPSFLQSVFAKVKEGGLQSAVVTKEQVELALAAITSSSSSNVSMKVIDVVSAFDMPRFHYDTVKKTFHAVQNERSKFGTADDKAEMLRSRYELLLQRLQRMPAFAPASNHAASSSKMDESENDPTEIVTIESLMGQG